MSKLSQTAKIGDIIYSPKSGFYWRVISSPKEQKHLKNGVWVESVNSRFNDDIMFYTDTDAQKHCWEIVKKCH